jgi:iron-sulfur cluster assembly accessory protein
MSDSGITLNVTKEAQDQVRDLIKSQKPGTVVRVYVQSGGGGGCGSGGCGCGGSGGSTFGMAFDRPRTGDKVVPVDSFSIVVDDLSAGLLEGATIDYVQELNVSGFKITSPNAPSGGPESAGGGCGCGSAGCGCG